MPYCLMYLIKVYKRLENVKGDLTAGQFDIEEILAMKSYVSSWIFAQNSLAEY